MNQGDFTGGDVVQTGELKLLSSNRGCSSRDLSVQMGVCDLCRMSPVQSKDSTVQEIISCPHIEESILGMVVKAQGKKVSTKGKKNGKRA